MKVSEWNKWDLHIHTDKSNESVPGDVMNFNYDLLIKKLVENNVKVAAFCDHNVFSSKYYDKAKEENDIVFLPGVEFNLDFKGNEKKNLHCLAIFKDETIGNTIDFENYVKKSCSKNLSLREFTSLFSDYSYVLILHGTKTKGVADTKNVDINGSVIEDYILLEEFALIEAKQPSVLQKKLKRCSSKIRMYLDKGIVKKTVNFSDNHDYMYYPFVNSQHKKDSKQVELSVLKANLTYEGLVMVVSEESRRRFDIPKYIDDAGLNAGKIEFINIYLKGKKEPILIEFSKELNSIVGPRSSGKSLLLKLIQVISKKEENEFKSYNQKAIDIDKVEVKTYFSPKPKVIKKSELGKVDLSIKARTIDQNDFIEILENKNRSKLDKNFSKYFSSNDVNIESISKIINEEKERYSKLIKSIKKFDNDYSKKTFNVNILDLIEEDVTKNARSKMINYKNNLVQSLVDELQINIEKDTEYKEFLVKEKGEIELKIETIKETFKNELSLVNSLITIYSNLLKEIEKTHLKIETRSLKYKGAKDNLQKLMFKEIDTDEFALILKAKKQYKDDFKKIGQDLKNIKKKSNLDFEDIKINEETSNEESNYKFKKSVELTILGDEIKSKIDYPFKSKYKSKDDKGTKKFVDKLLRGIIVNEKDFFNKDKDYDSVSGGLDNLFNVKIEQSYDILENVSNKSFKDYSPGGQAGILIELLFDTLDDETILIIDQPEDNLDSIFVSETVTDKIKKMKGHKQVILATHNANIAVLADSENIVYVKQEKNKEYEIGNGALEYVMEKPVTYGTEKCMTIKEVVCTVLEGGERAFKKRTEKYSIKEKI